MTGIRQHRDGWQVRVHPYPAKNFGADDLLDAIRWRDHLRDLRSRGVRELPAVESDSVTLGVIAQRYKQREAKRLTAERRSPASFKKLDYKLRPWVGDVELLDGLGRPMHERQIASLTPGDVDDVVTERALDHGTTARDELAGLRSVLRYAEDRGVTVDRRVYDVKAPAIKTREGLALSYPELEYVASFAFENDYRLILLLGTVGLRIMEALAATDDWLDADAMTLTVPAEACKERREKTILLTPEERDLLVEQQQQRVTRLDGPRLLFPRPRGTRYGSESEWHDCVFAPTVRRAIDKHLADHGVEPRFARWLRDGAGEIVRRKDGTQRAKSGNVVLRRGARRYEGLQPHDLRRTAISLMREAGMPEEYVAARVGHIDDGQLALKTYRKVRSDEQRRFIRSLGSGLGERLLEAHAADAEASL
jgi:integrase